VPDTVDPGAGDVIATCGGVVSLAVTATTVIDTIAEVVLFPAAS